MVNRDIDPMWKSEKRREILDAAHRLFDAQGFNATGVDQIASESGVTKRTLYKHFGSKEGLIEVVLNEHHEAMMERTRERVQAVPVESGARLIECLGLYREWFARSSFSGCIFVKTLNEYGQCSARLSSIASRAKVAMRDLLEELATEAGAQEAAVLADQLQIILEGCIVVAQACRGKEVMDTAKPLVEKLIQDALPG